MEFHLVEYFLSFQKTQGKKKIFSTLKPTKKMDHESITMCMDMSKACIKCCETVILQHCDNTPTATVCCDACRRCCAILKCCTALLKTCKDRGSWTDTAYAEWLIVCKLCCAICNECAEECKEHDTPACVACYEECMKCAQHHHMLLTSNAPPDGCASCSIM